MSVHRKRDSDDEEEILPIVRDIEWVTTSDFIEKKLDIGSEIKNGDISRVQLMYKYNGNKNVFCLTVPRDPSAYFRTHGVEEDSFLKKNGTRTMLGRNIMKLYLENTNEYHVELYNTLLSICSAVKKKLEKKNKKEEFNVKIKGLYDLKNDDKETTGHVLTVRLIESGNGVTYSSAYDDEEQVDIKKIGRCYLRPALVFTYVVPEEGNDYVISASISQTYVVKKSMFPLRDKD